MYVSAFGLKFSGLKIDELLSDSNDLKFIVTVNSEFVVDAHNDQDFRNIINENISTFDGQIPYFFAKLITKSDFEKISGSDLIYHVMNESKKNGRKIFFLGDKPAVNKRAVDVANKDYEANCFGYSPPFEPYPFSLDSNNNILLELNKVRPYYLFVGFGARKQEFWIERNKEALALAGVRFVVGCGGSISFVAGDIRRAPVFIQNIGLEGVYRLLQEPKLFRIKRLFKSLKFFKYIGR